MDRYAPPAFEYSSRERQLGEFALIDPYTNFFVTGFRFDLSAAAPVNASFGFSTRLTFDPVGVLSISAVVRLAS